MAKREHRNKEYAQKDTVRRNTLQEIIRREKWVQSFYRVVLKLKAQKSSNVVLHSTIFAMRHCNVSQTCFRALNYSVSSLSAMSKYLTESAL